MFRLFLTFMLLVLSNISGIQAFEEEKCEVKVSQHCVDNAPRNVGEYYVENKCWKYKEVRRCISKEQNYCAPFEDNIGCHQTTGKCVGATDMGECLSFNKRFVCGDIMEEGKEVIQADTIYNILRDEKDISECSKEEKDKYCQLAKETCIEGAETRNIEGKDVYKDCWKWDRQYLCRADTKVNSCGDLSEECELIKRECTKYEHGECQSYRMDYKCTDTEEVEIGCRSFNYCVAGICDKEEQKNEDDFKNTIPLQMLSNMRGDGIDGCKCPDGKESCSRGEIDKDRCKFFNGGGESCKVNLLDSVTRNCCGRGEGFLQKAKFLGCKDRELDLVQKRNNDLCVMVGTYCSEKEKLTGICLAEKTSFCCFKSKLNRIIQEQGRAQIGRGWGSAESPDCGGLSLAEIESIDFSKMNWEEFEADMHRKGKEVAKKAKDKIGNFANEANVSDTVSRRMTNFFETSGIKRKLR